MHSLLLDLSLHATMPYEEGHRAKCEPLVLDQKTHQNKPLFFIKSSCHFVILQQSRLIQWVCITDEEFQHQGLKFFHNVIEANIPFHCQKIIFWLNYRKSVLPDKRNCVSSKVIDSTDMLKKIVWNKITPFLLF